MDDAVQTQRGLLSFEREDSIHLFRAYDLSAATVEKWSAEVTAMLDDTTRPRKRLYDLRFIKDIPLRVIPMVTKTRSHRNIHFNYVAVVTNNSRVLGLVDLILRLTPGGRIRVMSDFDEAVAWLHQQVPNQPTD